MVELLDNRYKRLKDYPFPEILFSISKSNKTGILHLKNWPAEKSIYIKNGKIIFASSNIEEDCLGINLLTKGKITVVQYYESIRMLEKTGSRHGSILTELGYLTPKELEDAVKKQVEEVVLSIFNWEDGYFFFEDSPFTIEESITLDVDTPTLIYKGIKKMDSFPQIRNAMPLTTVLAPSPDMSKSIRKLKLGTSEKKIIGLIDGKKTVLDILTTLHGDDLEILKMLYALNCIEAVIPVDHPSTSETMLSALSEASSPEALYNKGTSLFMAGEYSASADVFKKAVSLSPNKASYHFYLAMSLINTSMFREAEDALKKAIEIEPFNDDYYTELGILYKKLGSFKKACRALEFAIRINPHNERALHALSETRKQKIL